MNRKFRQRFVKDFNLPINVLDEETFNYYMNLYDFFPKEIYENTIKLINNKYNGNVEAWLEYCGKVRDACIYSVTNSPEYQEFNTKNLDVYTVKPQCGERSCYTEETDGMRFVSIDLKKANMQALAFAGVFDWDYRYEDFIKDNGGDDYIASSKYLRQVIFGKMNPSRTIKVEKYIMCSLYSIIEEYCNEHKYELFSINSDEIILKDICPNERSMEDIKKELQAFVDYAFECFDIAVHVRAEYIEVKRLPIVNANGNKVDAYVRKNLVTGEEVLKKASTTFFPQIYKLWKGMEINDIDRKFFFEDQYATFNEPLKLLIDA